MKIQLTIFCVLIQSLIFAQQLKISEPIRFLALGDSYTIGQSVEASKKWPQQLYDSLNNLGYAVDTLKVIAQTGWRTDNLKNAIIQEKPSNDYNLVSLLIGVNNQYQNRPFLDYEPAFRELLDTAIYFAGGNTSNVFVVSIPDYAYTPFAKGNTRVSEELDKYNAINKKVADEKSIVYFDITPISRLGLDSTNYVASDNLHPSAIMYERWVDLMIDHISKNNIALNIKKSNAQIVNVIPNPIEDQVEITSTEVITAYQLVDMQGRVIHEKINQSWKNNVLNVTWLTQGTYFLKLTSDDKVITKKLIKL